MTWSIVARDPKSGAFAVAVTTCAFAVGARVPSGGGRIGALASQAFTNPLYMIDGLRLLQEGRSAEDIVSILTGADGGRGHRQLHVIDRAGRTAAWTGPDCVDWCGSRAGPEVSVAGNMLAGPQVVDATLEGYLSNSGRDFDDRLITALEAGQAVGGDKRGKQSAALLIHDAEEYPLVDVRVDDHPDPLTELARLESVHRERFVHFRRFGPNRTDPTGLTDRAKLEEAIASSIAEGYE